MGRLPLDESLERERQQSMRRFEDELRLSGFSVIAGVDEAGRGPLAGPVVAAAVVLPADLFIPGLNDSKQICSQLREAVYRRLIEAGVPFAVGIGTVPEIDELNILEATRLAMTRAVRSLPVVPDFILIDALTLPRIAVPQRGIVHGDALSLSIAAASIIAKVTRDRIMAQLDQEYAGYGFAKHKGYPTPEHYQALARLGPSPVHRRSFRLASAEQLRLEAEGGRGR